MEILLTMTYVAICFLLCPVQDFRTPINRWSLATAALGGIFGVS
jgi:hypothetical protein